MARRRGLMSEAFKYALARELGFAHEVRAGDWGEITAREAGSLVRAAIARAEARLSRRQGRPASTGSPPSG